MRHLTETKSSISRNIIVCDLLPGISTKSLTDHCSPDLLESQLYVILRMFWCLNRTLYNRVCVFLSTVGILKDCL